MASKSKRGRPPSRAPSKPSASATHAAYLTRAALCSLGRINEDQLTVWEFEDFIAHDAVVEIDGRAEPVYKSSALARIRVIRSLAEDLGINLAGIGVVLHLLEQLSSR